MKKTIFISMHYLEIGGAEISLIGLLKAIDYTRFNVDLFIHSHQGELMSLIPDEVNLLPEIKKYSMLERPLKEVLKNGYFDLIAGRLLAKWQSNRYMRKNNLQDCSSVFQYVAHNTTQLLPKINSEKEYDLAISFLTPHNIVRDKIKAKKKIAWIHTDYSKIAINPSSELSVWEAFDYIASISEEVTHSFLKIFPTLKEKVVLIENILSPVFVRERSKKEIASNEMPVSEDTLCFLSIGRFSYPKNFDNIPFIAKSILDKGIRFKWYIIGYGGDEALIRSNIKKTGMQNTVILLGKKSNPYPYIKGCDYYIQPSRYEGKSVTVREAQMLYKPVIVTDYPTAKSQINHKKDGVIVPLDNDLCAKGIVDFIANKQLQSQIIEYLKVSGFGNEGEVDKIEELMTI